MVVGVFVAKLQQNRRKGQDIDGESCESLWEYKVESDLEHEFCIFLRIINRHFYDHDVITNNNQK